MLERESVKGEPAQVEKIVEEMLSTVDKMLKDDFSKDIKKILEEARRALIQIKKEQSNGNS